MDSPGFLIKFSHNERIIVIVDRCEYYNQLVEQTVQATGGEIRAQDIDSFQYEATFGNQNVTITARNSKALHRIPKKIFYRLKCITKLKPAKQQQSLPMNIIPCDTPKQSSQARWKNCITINYKLSISRKQDSMSTVH